MIDTSTAQKIKTLHPIIRTDVESIVNYINEKVLTGKAKVRITQGFRTFEEQAALYNQGRTKPGKIVTNSRAGFSYHNYGLAFDICLLIDGKDVSWNIEKDFDKDLKSDWKEVAETFKYRGFAWGGDFKNFKDYPHFDKSNDYSLSALLKYYEEKKFIDGTKYVKL